MSLRDTPIPERPVCLLKLEHYIVIMQLPIVLLLIIFTAQAVKGLGEDTFRLLAAAWLTNLVYLIFGYAAKHPNDEIFSGLAEGLPATDIARVFNVLTLFFFLRGAQRFFQRHRPQTLLSKVPSGALIGGAAVVIVLEVLRSRSTSVVDTILHTPAVIIGSAALLAIAVVFDDTLRSRESERPSKSRLLLVGGTVVYALIQPFSLLPGDWPQVMGFTTGFLCKTAMVIGLVGGFVISAEAAARTHEVQRRLGHVARTIGRITHELGTPIRLLDNQVTALLHVAPSRGDFARHLQGLENTVLRIDAVMDATLTLLPNPDTLLDVGMLASNPGGALPARNLENTNINTLVQLAVMAVKETRGERVFVRTSYSGHCCVECVPFEVVQLLINVLRNAYDSIPPGTPGHIFVATRTTESDQVQVSVSDDGHGIPEGFSSTIFDDGVTTRFGPGRGYGMGMIKLLAERNRGAVDIASPASKIASRPGTTIAITFPRVKCLSKEERLGTRNDSAASRHSG